MKKRGKSATILDAFVDGARRCLACRTVFTGLFAVSILALGACTDDDNTLVDDPDPVVPEEPDKPDPEPNPDKALREDATPLFFDAAQASGIGAVEIEGEPNGYTLTINAEEGQKCFIPTVALKEPLENKRVKLVFEYRSQEDISAFNLGFSQESEMAYYGKIEADVDRDEDGWAPYSVSLVNDVDRNQWGDADDWLGFYLHPSAASGTVTFEIRDIYLEETDEPVDPVEPDDPNKYLLSFTNERAATPFESKYGRSDGIEYTRTGNEYHVVFVESNGNPNLVHNEHMFATDPLTRILYVNDNQKVELVFKYKASTNSPWQFTTMLQMTDESIDDFNATAVDCQTMKASANAEPDSEGWATYRHDLTDVINKMKWGQDLIVSPQIRFRFRLTRSTEITDPAHPEHYDFREIDLKDIYLQISDKGETPDPGPDDPTPVDGKYDLSFVLGTEGHANAEVSQEDGCYCISLTGNGGHGEHYAVTAPLSNALALETNQKAELVFTYKTRTQEEISGNDPIVANDKWQFTTYFHSPYYNDSECNDSNMKLSTASEEWVTYRLDLTNAITNTKFGTDAAKSQIRFRIRLTRKPDQGGGNPQCPELFGFDKLWVKDAYLRVYNE